MIYGCTCNPAARYRTYSTRTAGLFRARFLKCDHCGTTHTVEVRLDANGKEFPTTVLRHSTEALDGLARVREDETI